MRHRSVACRDTTLARDRVMAMVRARELAMDGAGRVRVVAEVDGEQAYLAKVLSFMEGPERRLE